MANKPQPIKTQSRGLRTLTAPLPPSTKSTRAPHNPYSAMVTELKSHYKISIRKWQSRMTGVAYELLYSDGSIKRLITAPRPRSPVSAAIFLHEVAHHAIGFKRYHIRCLEEYYAWQWTFRQMHARQIPITPQVQKHYRRSMHHYTRQAPHLPPELHPFLHSN